MELCRAYGKGGGEKWDGRIISWAALYTKRARGRPSKRWCVEIKEEKGMLWQRERDKGSGKMEGKCGGICPKMGIHGAATLVAAS